jgi:hypothetical protein
VKELLLCFCSLTLLFRTKIIFSEVELAEHSRIAKEYNRQMFIYDNQMKKDLSIKIWLQQEALRSLPVDLRNLAEVVDETPPPKNRPYPMWLTPPVPGLELENPDEDDNEDEEILLAKGDLVKDPYSYSSRKSELSEGGDGKRDGGDDDDADDADDDDEY